MSLDLFSVTFTSDIGGASGRPAIKMLYEANHPGPSTHWMTEVEMLHFMSVPQWTEPEKPYQTKVAIESHGNTAEEALEKLATYCERTAAAIRSRGACAPCLPFYPNPQNT